jgi:membrane protease YdiL (CAAX protease family)
MTRFASRHPLVFSVFAVLVAIVVIKLMGAGLADRDLSALCIRLTIEATFGGYVIFLLTSLWWWREAGFKQPVTRLRLWAYLPLLLVPVLVAASSGFQPASASQVIGFAILTLMVGFAEESLLRGVVLRVLLPNGVLRAALLSSLFFGLGHLVNIWQGASPFTTIVQVLYSIFLGIGFA